EVEVVVEATDLDATVVIEGGTDLQPGENTLTVTVTAADGETTAEYNVTLNVALNNDTTLNTFEVNGQTVADGDSVLLETYTNEVEIVVETTDPEATFTIDGGTDLIVGDNILTVTVIAADGVTTAIYTVTLVLPIGDNTELSTFQINGSDVVDGDVIELPAYTTEVEVLAEAVDTDATIEVFGDSDLQQGENELTVTVTAADGQTTQDYILFLNVALGNNTELAVFAVDGADVADGDSLDLDPYTTSVEVATETVDPEATVDVEGDTDLQPGENILTVTVTAVDGETTQVYTVTLNVALGNDVELATFEVDGIAVNDGDAIELDPYTTEVDVLVETSDPDAAYSIEGDTDLETGDNTLVVTVTAADGETTQDYTVTLTVLPSSDTALDSFSVDGYEVVDGDIVDLDPYTTEVEVAVITSDENATFAIDGGADLVSGENTLTVTVTAVDGTTQEYVVVLVVALGDSTELATFQVNGEDVSDGDFVDLAPYTTEVEVVVEAVDPDATVQITGATDLQPGENEMTVTVTAADGETSQDYTIVLSVALSSNTDLATFTVNGQDVLDGDTVNLDPYTTEVEVVAEASDPDATIEVSGDSMIDAAICDGDFVVVRRQPTCENGDIVAA
ncbi:MAG: hypothetical protein EBT26_09475, partial [Microbacteriaceae bacterium]|nr:hypothetical protein [Microbacteriaceae bacterium]